jgi:bile acid:Na+ symporter, BASS family
MRNTSLCLAIALRSFPGAHVEFPVVAFSALMLPPNVLFTIFHMRKARKLAPTQAV